VHLLLCPVAYSAIALVGVQRYGFGGDLENADELGCLAVGKQTPKPTKHAPRPAASSRGCEASRGIAQVSAGDQTSQVGPSRS
jgi:hypothetical protein